VIGRALVVAGTLAAFAPMANADSCPSTFRFQLENDSEKFRGNVGPGADEYYTGGVRTSVTFCLVPPDLDVDEHRELRRASRWLELVPLFGDKNPDFSRILLTVGAGLKFYTPVDIGVATRETADRPYAAELFAFGETRVEHMRPPFETLSARLEVGALGEHAFGRSFQTFIHDYVTTHARSPRGWQHQTGEGLAAQATVGWQRSFGGSWVDVVPSVDVSGGTVMGAVDLGLRLRVGRFPPGPDSRPIDQTIPELAHIADVRDQAPDGESASRLAKLVAPPRCRTRVHGFASFRTRLVGWSSFIEGTPGAHDPYVQDARWYVLEGGAGFAFDAGCWGVTYANYVRSREMDGVDKEPSWHPFTEIQIAYSF
jgi:hypothetical protein